MTTPGKNTKIPVVLIIDLQVEGYCLLTVKLYFSQVFFFFFKQILYHLSHDESPFILCYELSWTSQVVVMLKNSPAKAGDVRDAGLILGHRDLQRREWQPTPVFMPGESHGDRSLVGDCP